VECGDATVDVVVAVVVCGSVGGSVGGSEEGGGGPPTSDITLRDTRERAPPGGCGSDK
jgi:hypothetical protein